MILDVFENTEKLPSQILDPFSIECLKSVRIHMSEKSHGDGWYFIATIETRNGNTKGEQKVHGESPEDLLKKVGSILEELKT